MKNMVKRERFMWLALLMLVVTTIAWAAEEAPWIVTDSQGATLHNLNASGYIQNTGARQKGPASNWVVQNSAGTAKAGFQFNGTILSLDADDSSGTKLLDGSAEVTVTFGVAEADTNYYIVGSLANATTNVTDTVYIKRKNAATFVIGNGPQYTTPVTFDWVKLRHTQ